MITSAIAKNWYVRRKRVLQHSTTVNPNQSVTEGPTCVSSELRGPKVQGCSSFDGCPRWHSLLVYNELGMPLYFVFSLPPLSQLTTSLVVLSFSRPCTRSPFPRTTMTETTSIHLTTRTALRTPNDDPTNQRTPKNAQGENDEPQGNENHPQESVTPQTQPPPASNRKTWRFWAVFPALCVTTFLAALDTSILSTALPTIALDPHAGVLYI